MAKYEDNPMARGSAENMVADLFGLATGEQVHGGRDTRDVVELFRTVQFETTETKVRGGGTVPLRRLVLTTDWEVDPNGLQ